MRVTVAQTPGRKAVAVNVREGGNVLEALKAASMDSSLGEGYEVRVNNEIAQLSDTVPENSIITLTAKITGNADDNTLIHINFATECRSGYDGGKEQCFIFQGQQKLKNIIADEEVNPILTCMSDVIDGAFDASEWNALVMYSNDGTTPDEHIVLSLSNARWLRKRADIYVLIFRNTLESPDPDTAFKEYFAVDSDRERTVIPLNVPNIINVDVDESASRGTSPVEGSVYISVTPEMYENAIATVQKFKNACSEIGINELHITVQVIL